MHYNKYEKCVPSSCADEKCERRNLTVARNANVADLALANHTEAKIRPMKNLSTKPDITYRCLERDKYNIKETQKKQTFTLQF